MEQNSIEYNSQEVFFAKKHIDVKLPSKRDEDGGYDIYADMRDCEVVRIEPFSNVIIPTGIFSAFDSKYRFVFQERGSSGVKNLKVNAGLIDSGFRGEWMVILYNMNTKPVLIYKEGIEKVILDPENFIMYPSSKAICQAKLEEVPKPKVSEISLDDLLNIESERGSGMLGSSGK